MKKIIFLFAFGIVLTSNTLKAQDFPQAATDVYVMEYFTNPGQFGTIPLAGPYYPIPNVITNNAFTMLGGDFNASGTLYTVVYQNPDYILGTVDLSNGAVNYAATISGLHAPEFLSQLSYNVTNDTFYALSHDPNNSTGTQFYSLNVTTGALTEIGPGTGIGNGVAMEIDNNGVVYAADANSGNLYTIDINTGIGAVVGNMRPDGFYPVGQGFSIDKSTNTMYAVLTNSNGLIRSAFYTVNVSNGALTLLGDGSSRQYSLFVIADQPLGVVDINLDSFRIYPNPASSRINIENPQGLLLKNVKLFDMLGRDTGAVFANDEINIENLAKGIYLLQLETEGGTTTKKIVKE